MERVNSYQLEDYSQKLESLYEELSKAGVSIKYSRFFTVSQGTIYEFILENPVPEETFNSLYRIFIEEDLMPIQYSYAGEIVLRILPIKRRSRRKLQILLMVATFITVWFTGYGLTLGFLNALRLSLDDLTIILWSTIYALIFLIALGLHELGHLFIARSYRVPASGPYFIPAPPIQLGFLGTLGAIISMEGLPPNRRILGLLGIMGPLSGFLIATLIGVIGIFLSPTIPIETAQKLIETGEATPLPFMPLMLIILSMIRMPPPNETLILHPLAFITFIIYIITFINLMPIGQLDGGHVVRTFTSSRVHMIIGTLSISIIALIGLILLLLGYGVTIYLTLAFVLLIFKFIFGSKPHPGAANNLSKISSKDYLILITYIVLIILTAPIPLM